MVYFFAGPGYLVPFQSAYRFSNAKGRTWASLIHTYVHTYIHTYILTYIHAYKHTGDGQNNGNTRQYRNKTVCVGCTESTLVVSIVRFFFFVCLLTLCSAIINELHIVFITVRMKMLQNGRRVRFSKRTDFWCERSCIICNQKGHFVRCIHSSSFCRYDGIHNSWEDIISFEVLWPLRTATTGLTTRFPPDGLS